MTLTLSRDEMNKLLRLAGQASLRVWSCDYNCLRLDYNGKGFTMRPRVGSDGDKIWIDVNLDSWFYRCANIFGSALDMDICSQLQEKTRGIFRRNSRKDGYIRVSDLLEHTKLPVNLKISSLSIADEKVCLEASIANENQNNIPLISGLGVLNRLFVRNKEKEQRNEA